MMISICADVQGRVTGVCPDNLTGGQGWVWIETDLTPATKICDERGTALYKYVNGVVCARTAEEISADVTAQGSIAPEPTIDERLAAVEAATLDLMLGGGF